MVHESGQHMVQTKGNEHIAWQKVVCFVGLVALVVAMSGCEERTEAGGGTKMDKMNPMVVTVTPPCGKTTDENGKVVFTASCGGK